MFNKNILVIFVLLISIFIVSVTFSEQVQESLGINTYHQSIRMIKKTEFSDEIKVKSKIHKLKHYIKKNRTNQIVNLLSEDFEDSLGVVKGKSYAKEIFNTLFKSISFEDRDDYSNRRKPKVKNITPNWDFEIDIKEVKVHRIKKKAEVICDVYFKYDQPDIELESDLSDYLFSSERIDKKIDGKKKDDKIIEKEKKSKNVDIVIDLKCRNGQWQIIKFDKLFQFVDKRNKKLNREKYGNAS